MYTDLIKYLTIFLISFYINFKLLRRRIKSFQSQLFYLIFSLALSFLTSVLISYYPWATHLTSVLILWILESIYTSHPQISFIVVTVSLGISYCIHGFASFFSTALIYSIIGNQEHFFFLIVAILSSILHYFITLGLFKIKRFRNGLPLIYSNNYMHFITLLCIVFISLSFDPLSNHDPLEQRALFLFIILITLTFLIYWWQAQITKSYRRSLELRELESLRTEITEKDVLIQKLMKDNDNLARISHRDNSLISALKYSTIKYLSTDYTNPSDAIIARDKLISNINAVSAGRNSFSHSYDEKIAKEFDTGLSLLNDLLSHMDLKASKQNIVFSVHLGIFLNDYVPDSIEENDLVHIVDDLLKNAFQATSTSKNGVVQLQFYKFGKHLVVEVSDNGIPFEIRSLVNMGIQKLTTHKDGSGIGLMDIWCTKEKYRATYHIDEYSDSSPFSKKISLTFDKKNRYTIRSYRKNAILEMSQRADLQIYDFESTDSK